MVDRAVKVAIRISSLDRLTTSVYQQQTAFTSPKTSRHFITEIHVPRRINQVDKVLLPLVGMQHRYRLRFDGDASLALDVELVQDLVISSWAFCDCSCHLQKSVCECRFAVLRTDG